MEVWDRENFATEVLGSKGIVVVDWWGPRCAPCLALLPRLEELARKYAGRVRFGKVNAAENRRLAIEQRVMGLPAIVIYRDGVPVAAVGGDAARPEAVEEQIRALLP